MAVVLLLSSVAVLIGTWWGIARVLKWRGVSGAFRALAGGVCGVGLAVAYFNLFVQYYRGGIHDEASAGDYRAVRKFLESGGDVNQKHKLSGGNVLSYAAGSGSLELVNYLLAKGAEINGRATDGSTAMHYAAREGHVKVVDLLISRGAAMDVRADGVEVRNWEEIAHGPMTGTPLHYAAAYDRDQVVAVLLDRGADPNTQDKFGLTPLHEAARRGNTAVATLLMKAGAAVDGGKKGIATPLHIAVNEDKPAMTRLLLEHGADVNATGVFGPMVMEVKLPVSRSSKPLDLAKSEEIKKILREHGAK